MSIHALPLPLPTPAPLETPTLRSVPPASSLTQPEKRQRRSVWLAIHLHGWQLHAALTGLDAQAREKLSSKPMAVVESDRRATVVACNAIALARGVRPGHSMNASIALCADTQFLPRDCSGEDRLLNELATHCERYTSTVSAEPPNELLLEIRGSIKLFGGIDALIDTVQSDLSTLGLIAQIAIAPTAQSGLWLARATSKPIVVPPRRLLPTMARLPVSYLLWPAEIELRLARFGVRTIGDLLRLPRAGLARRIGHERLLALDQAMGRHRQVRKLHRSSEPYRDVVLLDFEIETTELLRRVIEKRFSRLNRYLIKRSLTTARTNIELKHRDQPVTSVVIGLARPTSDTTHIAKLMHEHLAKLALPAPVTEISIVVDRFQQQVSAARELFSRELLEGASDSTNAQARLLEQLASRFGEQAIQQLAPQSDYRPERANQIEQASVHEAATRTEIPRCLARRPLWLLSAPRAVRTRRSVQLRPTEIIESGWWDGTPVHREYGLAHSAQGSVVWAFREAAHAEPIFVHGLFG